MCELFGVSRSGYYAWLQRPESERSKRRKRLTKKIHRIYLESRRLYGSPKITQKLLREGERVSQKTVSRIMKEHQLRSVTVKKYKATTNSKHSLPVHENVLNQTFTATAPGEIWMTDITCVPTREGWLYLASVMDLYSRMIVGWYMDSRMTKDLVLKALDRAYARHKPPTHIQTLHHSDRGSQYASVEYQERIRNYGMTGSMSRKGNCYDNACIESFHSVIKRELIHRRNYRTRRQASKEIFAYVETWYNRVRIHSSIAYRTPAEMMKDYHRRQRSQVS